MPHHTIPHSHPSTNTPSHQHYTGGLGLTLRAFSLGAIATSFIGCFLSIVEEFNEFLRSMSTPSTPAPAPLLTLPAASEEVAAAVAPVVEVVEEVVEEVEVCALNTGCE